MFEGSTPVLMQRARGSASIAFGVKNGQSRLSDLHQAGCLKLMIPRTHSALPDAVLINTAGGLTGGDQLRTEVSVARDASVRLSTQTAERIYKSRGENAEVSLDFQLGNNARFDWLAQETILFDEGRMKRSINVDLESDASMLIVEPIVLGRQAMGETVESGLIFDTWRVKRDKKLIFAEATKISDMSALRASAALGDARAMATVLLIDPNAEAKRGAILPTKLVDGVHAGATAWNGMLLIRALSEDPLKLRNTLKDIMKTLRGKELPRVWTM